MRPGGRDVPGKCLNCTGYENATMECNGRRLLVSRVFCQPRVSEDPLPSGSLIVQFGAIPVQLPPPIVSAIVRRLSHRALLPIDLHRSRIAVRSQFSLTGTRIRFVCFNVKICLILSARSPKVTIGSHSLHLGITC